MSDNNNNKRPNDGRKNNKRQDRVKIIKNKSISLPAVNKAKKDRSKALSKKAIKNIFVGEDGVWEHLANMAKDGNMKALELLLTYQYGKAGEAKTAPPVSNRVPVIQFNTVVDKPEEDTIDITHATDDE